MAASHLSPAQRAGDLVFTSGQLAFANGKLEGDITAQTKQVIANLETVLGAYGLGLKDIVKTTCWITKSENFGAFNDAYAAAFGDHKPARSTTIAGLALAEALVEIEAVAVVRK